MCGQSVAADSASVYLEAGRDYNLRAEYWDNRDYAIARLQWRVPSAPASTRLDMFGEAGDVARKSDVVVAVMGINKSIEREGQDRYDISLPDDQREFLRELYKVNRNIVLVSFDLSNTGRYDGDEVAQVYMRLPEYGCAIAPLKELKGFRRVSVARGKRERVAIAVPKSSLRYCDETTGGFVTVPAGLYDVFVGSSSADIRLQTAIML